MTFEGFPASARFTSVPDYFINQLAPGMSAAEIILMLAVFNLLFSKKGYPRSVTTSEIAAHPALGKYNTTELLDVVVAKGFLLPQHTGGNAAYFLNNPEGRRAVGKTAQDIPRHTEAAPPQPEGAPTLPDTFTLYETNIGLITPMIAEELKDFLNTYPEEWVQSAIKEAVSLNKRSLRYVQRILERWVAEGKNSYGTYQPNTERDKFVRGHYGELVQR